MTRQQKWRKENPEKIRVQKKAWRMKNPEKIKLYAQHWRRENPEKLKAQKKAWRLKNRIVLRLINRQYRITNRVKIRQARQGLIPRLKHTLSERIRKAVSGFRNKSAKTEYLIGCSIEHLRVWLTFWFQPGMSWANYGEVWHIDHDRPCASFNLVDPVQQRECFHYSNLRPLFVKDNLAKGDNWEPVLIPDPGFDLIQLAKTG